MSKILTKVYLSSLLILSIISCSTPKSSAIYQEHTQNDKTKILIGKVKFQHLMTGTYNEWFDEQYITYKIDTLTLDTLNNNPEKLNSLTFKLFFATWCEDSQKEVPRLYKIFQYLKIVSKCELIALDRNKMEKGGNQRGLDIEYVPTLVIYQYGKEINRIIESPIETLEKDLIKITQHSSGSYIPKYK